MLSKHLAQEKKRKKKPQETDDDWKMFEAVYGEVGEEGMNFEVW